MEPKELKPPKAANLLHKASELLRQIDNGNRFPVDIDVMAKGAAELFQWKDPITEIKAIDLPNFEGMLAANDSRSKWMLAYNNNLSSEGRIRFTKAHELGHYMLHKDQKAEFRCSKEDMLKWEGGKDIEAEADKFASHLLMPLDDFRLQMNGDVNIDSLGSCATRYGVSLTAAILKWLSYTEEKAVLVVSRDGFMDWASSSDTAKSAGAYYKTKSQVIEIPAGSLCSNANITEERLGVKVAAKKWFPHADSNADLREMKIFSDQYDCTMSLLILPKYVDCWPQKEF